MISYLHTKINENQVSSIRGVAMTRSLMRIFYIPRGRTSTKNFSVAIGNISEFKGMDIDHWQPSQTLCHKLTFLCKIRIDSWTFTKSCLFYIKTIDTNKSQGSILSYRQAGEKVILISNRVWNLKQNKSSRKILVCLHKTFYCKAGKDYGHW